MNSIESLKTFSKEDVQKTQPAMKVGLLATITPGGLPHVTMLSSLMACSPSSCRYLRCNCHSSFCSMRSVPTRRMIDASLGKIPTTFDRRLISFISRSSGFVDANCFQ